MLLLSRLTGEDLNVDWQQLDQIINDIQLSPVKHSPMLEISQALTHARDWSSTHPCSKPIKHSPMLETGQALAHTRDWSIFRVYAMLPRLRADDDDMWSHSTLEDWVCLSLEGWVLLINNAAKGAVECGLMTEWCNRTLVDLRYRQEEDAVTSQRTPTAIMRTSNLTEMTTYCFFPCDSPSCWESAVFITTRWRDITTAPQNATIAFCSAGGKQIRLHGVSVQNA